MTFQDAKGKLDSLVDMVKEYDIKENLKGIDLKELKELKELKDLAKFKALLKHEEEEIEEEKKTNAWIWVLAIIGTIVVCAGIGYAIYRFLVPDYIEDSFDDFEDFDDDFFEDDDDLTNWEDVDKIDVDAKKEDDDKKDAKEA